MADPCWEFLISDMAALCGGAVCYGIYTTCSVNEVEYQLENGDADFFCAENQEFVDKLLNTASARASHSQDHRVRYAGAVSIHRRAPDQLRGCACAWPRARLAEMPNRQTFLDERAAAVRAEDIAVLVYTSGTTGPPKGAMHDHVSLMWGFANSYLEAFPELNTGEHRAVSHLPMAHLIERSMSICLPLVADVVPHIGEEVEDLLGTLYEVQPTFLNVVPRILEKIASQVVIGMQRSSFVKRHIYTWAMAIGTRYRQAIWAGRRPGFSSFASGRTRRSRRLPAAAAQDRLVKNSSDSLRRSTTAARRFRRCGRSGRQRPQPVRHHRRRLCAVSGADISVAAPGRDADSAASGASRRRWRAPRARPGPVPRLLEERTRHQATS